MSTTVVQPKLRYHVVVGSRGVGDTGVDAGFVVDSALALGVRRLLVDDLLAPCPRRGGQEQRDE